MKAVITASLTNKTVEDGMIVRRMMPFSPYYRLGSLDVEVSNLKEATEKINAYAEEWMSEALKRIETETPPLNGAKANCMRLVIRPKVSERKFRGWNKSELLMHGLEIDLEAVCT